MIFEVDQGKTIQTHNPGNGTREGVTSRTSGSSRQRSATALQGRGRSASLA